MILLLLSCGEPEPVFADPAVVLMGELDTDGSGSLTLEELYAPNPWRVMKQLDKNANSRLELDELRRDLDAWPITTVGASHRVRQGGGK